MISLTIAGKPVGKARPKFFRRGKFVGVYSPQQTEEGKWMLLAKEQLEKIGMRPMQGSVSITTFFYMPRPKSHFGSGKKANTLKETAPLYHTTKPDIDNLQKYVFDCLNGLFVWRDDAQICESFARKEYSDNPRSEIKIMEVAENAPVAAKI